MLELEQPGLFGLGGPALGDVHVDADHPPGRTARIVERLAPAVDPAHGAVGPDDPKFLLEHALGQRRRHLGGDHRPVIGVHHFQHAFIGAERSRRQPEELELGGRPLQLAAGDVPVPGPHAARFQRQAELGLAPEFPVGDVVEL